MSSSVPQSSGVLWRLLIILVPGAVLISVTGWWLTRTSSDLAKDFERPSVKRFVVESEALILAMSPRLKSVLGASVLNLSFDNLAADEIFTDRVDCNLLETDGLRDATPFRQLDIAKSSWQVSDSVNSVSAEKIWRSMFDQVDYFERAKFSIVRAEFADAKKNALLMEVAFGGLAVAENQSPIAVQANLELSWQFKTTLNNAAALERNDPNNWQIAGWKTKSMELSTGVRRLFVESLDSVVPDETLRHRLRHSIHEDHIVAKYSALQRLEQQRAEYRKASPTPLAVAKLDWKAPHAKFSVVAQDRHPAVSIVDIDQDGFDDIYVMSRWDRNVLLRNKQDGTFEDVAPQMGLDIDSHCSSAIFCDVDNDGDADLVLGRTLKRSQLLINENGKFVDHSQTLVDVELPFLVSSVSVADYNNDGLLDIYFSTYAANMLHDERDETPNRTRFLNDFLSEQDVDQLLVRLNRSSHHRYLDYSGPPNLLLTNVGDGHFEQSSLNNDVQGWRHSYQGSWSDYDGDGDQDLYVANDFAVNDLYRNDGDRFVNVAVETKSTDIGFGMGASWGDYDNDSCPDLYVSNMHSKAGRRITGQLEKIDDRFARMAGGNSLFGNSKGFFTKASGTQLPKMLVEKAGWSWGSQFVDVNNDGFLDVYALSGYYSAPASVAVQTDL